MLKNQSRVIRGGFASSQPMLSCSYLFSCGVVRSATIPVAMITAQDLAGQDGNGSRAA